MKDRCTMVAAAVCCMLACWNASAQQAMALPALQTAAARGNVQAIVQLAARYENADGVAQDYARANSLYCRAAALGDSEALVRLGLIYSNGRAVPQDEGISAQLFSRAAELGSLRARELLQYVSRKTDTVMPECLDQTEPVVAAADTATQTVPDAGTGAATAGIEALVHRLAPQYSVDPKLVMAVIATESSFNVHAVSPRNAQGLMQLIPATAQRFGVTQTFNAVENLKGGLAYLQWLMAFFKGDVALVLAAYNAGERAVERYRGIPPYAETREYVRRITSVYSKSVHPYLSQITEPSPFLNMMRRPRAR